MNIPKEKMPILDNAIRALTILLCELITSGPAVSSYFPKLFQLGDMSAKY